MGTWADKLKAKSKAIDEKLSIKAPEPAKKTLAEVIDPRTLALRFVIIKHVGNAQKVVAWTMNEQEADQTLRALESKDRITVDEFGEMQRTHYTKLQERLWHKTRE